MNDVQENKLSMYRTVKTVLTTHEAEFAGIPALVAQRQAFSDSIQLIDQLAQNQGTETSGITVDKANLQQQMIDTTLRVAGAVKALASVQNDATVEAQADLNKSSFTRVRDELRDEVAQAIHNLAQSKLALLADYGITAATLSGLQTRIDAYRLAVANPQTAKAQRHTYTTLLADEFRRADSILQDRLDGLVEQFKESGTTFYADYQNARRIVHTGSTAAPAAPPAPTP